MIEKILSIVAPPKLGLLEEYRERVEWTASDEHIGILIDSAGEAKPKKYRNGIERYFAEEREAPNGELAHSWNRPPADSHSNLPDEAASQVER